MSDFTLHDLQCFEAVVSAGGFQAAATRLHRSHPAVFAAVARLEAQLGLCLLDRSGYRVAPTDVGRSFLRRARGLLAELDGLRRHAAQLAMGEESELRVVVGDLCPLPPTLGLLGRFFARSPSTRLHLHFEAVSGPRERLLDGDADLILHPVDQADPRLEWLPLCRVPLVPVAAPGFVPFPVSQSLRPEQLRDLTQCVIRDTARHSPPRDYFLIEGAPQCTVANHAMKKEIVVQGLGWGHLPRFLIERELRQGRLLSLAGRHLPGLVEELVAARRADRPRGPVATRLWQHLGEQASTFRAACEGKAARVVTSRNPSPAPRRRERGP